MCSRNFYSIVDNYVVGKINGKQLQKYVSDTLNITGTVINFSVFEFTGSN